MPNYKLTIAYDGTNYVGFQVQPNGPTIQAALMRAATELFGQGVTITGAGRTDSGVHARGQVVALRGDKAIPEDKVPMAMNVRLPEDIVVMACTTVGDDWHPRYQEHLKTYHYKISQGLYQSPLDRFDRHHFKKKLDIQKMQQAAELMVGTHDFESYASAGKSVTDTVRTIESLTVTEHEQTITIAVTGNGFLYNMVRIIAGTLIEVGWGKRALSTIEASLKNRDRTLTGPTAPAKGLTLMHVHYPKEALDTPSQSRSPQ